MSGSCLIKITIEVNMLLINLSKFLAIFTTLEFIKMQLESCLGDYYIFESDDIYIKKQ